MATNQSDLLMDQENMSEKELQLATENRKLREQLAEVENQFRQLSRSIHNVPSVLPNNNNPTTASLPQGNAQPQAQLPVANNTGPAARGGMRGRGQGARKRYNRRQNPYWKRGGGGAGNIYIINK